MSDIGQRLRKVNLRSTPVRRSLLARLQDASHALSAQELEAESDSDRVTVYRTLKTFETHGLAHRVVDGTGADKYAACSVSCTHLEHTDHHPHFHCETCGNTTCLNTPVTIAPALPEHFILRDAHLVLRGTCGPCAVAAA